MELLVKQIMRVKDMFLKNENFIFYFILITSFLFVSNAYSTNNDKEKALYYLSTLNNFSASFLQNDGENLSEGKVYIGDQRVRAEYLSPTQILIILDEDKAMYYNYDLEEDEFFNPKNTNAWIFYDIFRNPRFFEDGNVEIKNNELVLEKKGVAKDENNFLIRVFFEKKPLVLRSIEVINENENLKLSIYNHRYYEEFDKDFFKLINPTFLN